MKIILNSKPIEIDEITVDKLLQTYDILNDQVVVEINREIVHREDYLNIILKENDAVEVVRFVGGG